MTASRKILWFDFVLRRWLSRILKTRFHGVYVAGGEHIRSLDASYPAVGCVNHTNWWDGFVLYVLSHHLLPHDIHLVMEEKNLRRYPFFGWMGALGVDLSNPRAALRGLRGGLSILAGKKRNACRLIWIFVQGGLRHPRVAVDAKPGALFLARKAGASILPLVMRYEWLGESRPTVFVRAGAPLTANCSAKDLSEILNKLLARTDADIEPLNLTEYKSLFQPRMSVNKRWDYFVHILRHRGETFDRYNR